MTSENRSQPVRFTMAAFLYELKWRSVGWLGKLLLEMLFLTTRIEISGREAVQEILHSRKYISAFWHSRLLLVVHQSKYYKSIALVSQSDDGEIMARVLERTGHLTVRGSSTRGGLRAVVKMIRHIKKTGRPVAMVPDGPQGPRFEVQAGVITLARKTGLPIIPVTYSARRMKVFNSWDRFLLPYPFTRCRLVYGKPVYVSPDADKKQLARARKDLEDELNRITRAADRYFNHDIE